MTESARSNPIVAQPFFSGEDTEAQLLSHLGIRSVNELFSSIPASVQETAGVNLPDGLDEWEIADELNALASKNTIRRPEHQWLGAGAYRYPTPTTVDDAIRRAEFLTCYTPYQPEVSQGSLQALFEYQTITARLLGTEISNGSIYDGPTALAEALSMALRINRKTTRVFVSERLSTIIHAVLTTYFRDRSEELIVLSDSNIADLTDGDIVAIGYPDALGRFNELAPYREAVGAKGLIITYTPDPHALSLVKSPGEAGADIAIAEGQSFGVPLSFGGPYIGMFGCSQKHLRQMPGRVAGRTQDNEGRDGFVLTLSTREQHIRREKATSNICSNQGLIAVAFTVYAATLGWNGLGKLSSRVLQRRIDFEKALSKAGFHYENGFRYNETLVTDPRFATVAAALSKQGILCGIDATQVCDAAPDGSWLVCAPAMGTDSQIATVMGQISDALASVGGAS